jgi:hypothetical protein
MQVTACNVYDRLLGLDQVPWNQRFKDDEKKAEASRDEAKKRGFTVRKEGTRPWHQLKEYAGDYEHPGYGLVSIALEKEGLKLTYNRMSGPLKHFHYDVFEVAEDELNPLQRTKVSFATSLQGEIDSLWIPLESSVKEIVFKRMAAKLGRKVLESLTGQYELTGTPATVSLRDGEKLFMEVPGQQARELTPIRGLLFSLQGLTGYSVEFKKDAAGVTTEAVLYQPNGTFVVKRKN